MCFIIIVFIRQALLDNSIRLDGRGVDDYRELSIQLERSESSSTSEVQLGNTIVVAVITGEIVPPFPDRPVEGILQFSSRVSPQTELTGISPWELTRMLERSLKHSEALDTESLCIVGGEKVWQINCDINIIDGSGGNIIDVCMLSVISALKAFRKPDISVIPCIYEEDDIMQPVKGFGLAPISGTGRPNVNILVHHSNNREPLPLALHHTPITVTLGVVKGYMTPVKSTTEEVRPYILYTLSAYLTHILHLLPVLLVYDLLYYYFHYYYYYYYYYYTTTNSITTTTPHLPIPH